MSIYLCTYMYGGNHIYICNIIYTYVLYTFLPFSLSAVFFDVFFRQPVGHDLVFQDILATCGCSTLGAAGGRENTNFAGSSDQAQHWHDPSFCFNWAYNRLSMTCCGIYIPVNSQVGCLAVAWFLLIFPDTCGETSAIQVFWCIFAIRRHAKNYIHRLFPYVGWSSSPRNPSDPFFFHSYAALCQL